MEILIFIAAIIMLFIIIAKGQEKEEEQFVEDVLKINEVKNKEDENKQFLFNENQGHPLIDIYGSIPDNMETDKHITSLMNTFINLENRIKLALEKNDYERAAKLRDERRALEKQVFDNIIPWINIQPIITLKIDGRTT